MIARCRQCLPSLTRCVLDHGSAWLVLVAAVSLAYPTWQVSGQWGFDDLSHLNGPQRALLAWFYQHGQWPLWNPFSFGGQPFLAAGQAGPLYPLNALYALLPLATALKASAWLHACLAALGMYGYSWQLTRSRCAACLAGSSFATCGFLLGHQIHTQMFDAFCWAPWAAWATERLLCAATPRWPAGIRLAVPLALAVLAGHPQAVFQILVWLALQTSTALLVHRPRPWRGALAVAFGSLLGLGLAAPQWLPTLALVHYSDRVHPDPAFLLEGSFPPSGWLQLLTPVGDAWQPASLDALQWLVGSRLFWEYTCYAGLITLLLAVAAVGALRRPAGPALRLTLTTGVSALLALGDNGPLGAWLVHAPGFNLFRIPARYTGLLDLGLAPLAALTLARLMAGVPADLHLRRWLRGAALAAITGLAAAWWAGPLRDAPAWTLASAAAMCALLGLVLNLPLPRRWLGLLVTGLAVADSTVHAALLAPFVLVPAAPYAHPSATVRYVRAHLPSADPYGKVAALGETSLAYDQAAAFQIPAINGYDSLVPDWYDRYVALTWNDWTLFNQPRSLLDALDVRYLVTPADQPLPTPAPGVTDHWQTWLAVPPDGTGLQVHLQPFTTQWDDRPLCAITLTSGGHSMTEWLYNLPTTEYFLPFPAGWPRGQLLQVTVVNESWNTAFRLDNLAVSSAHSRPVNAPVQPVLAPQPWPAVWSDGRETVWANPHPTAPAWLVPAGQPVTQHGPGSVHLVHWQANASSWLTDAPAHSELVLAQTYDPGWHAWVDGHPVTVQPLSGAYSPLLTAVAVPAGQHVVQLTYRPLGWRAGWALAGGSVAVVAAGLLWAWRRPRPPSGAPSTHTPLPQSS